MSRTHRRGCWTASHARAPSRTARSSSERYATSACTDGSGCGAWAADSTCSACPRRSSSPSSPLMNVSESSGNWSTKSPIRSGSATLEQLEIERLVLGGQPRGGERLRACAAAIGRARIGSQVEALEQRLRHITLVAVLEQHADAV